MKKSITLKIFTVVTGLFLLILVVQWIFVRQPF